MTATSFPELRCPACRAPFRETTTCSRCGADLSTLMLLAALAWKKRQAARRSLLAGDLSTAKAHALAAQDIWPSTQGRNLVLILNTLRTTPPAPGEGAGT